MQQQEELFAVRSENRDGIQRLFFIGQLDLVSVALFRHEVDGFRLEDALIIDLRHLTFVDMAGLRAIDGFLQRTVRPGFQALFVNASPRVRDTFVAAGKGGLLNPDATTAVAGPSGADPIRRVRRRMHPIRLKVDQDIDG